MIPRFSRGKFGGIRSGTQGGVGEGKPSPRSSFGGGWEGGFDQLISSRLYMPEAKASADLPSYEYLKSCIAAEPTDNGIALRKFSNSAGNGSEHVDS